MSDPWAEIEEYARSKRSEHIAAQRAEQTDEKFAQLEQKLDTLADGMTKLVSSQQKPPDASDDGGAAPDGEGERTPEKPKRVRPVKEEPQLPVQSVSRGSIPRIYTGDDEPAEVEYIDGPSGETRTRPGRRKGHPTVWIVEPYDEAAPGENEDESSAA